MFGFLDKYIFYQYCKMLFCIILFFFPLIYFADFLIYGMFDPVESLMKVLFRYGQMIGVISFISSYVTVKYLIYKHEKWVFISLGYKKSYLLILCVYITFIISTVVYLIIIPFNDKVFDYKRSGSNWAIIQNNNEMKYVYDSKQNFYDIWEISKDSKIKNYQKKICESKINKDDFYITWNETKKMSFNRLEEYKKYLDKNNFSKDDYEKQKQVYYSRFLVIFVMLLCGFIVAWDKSIYFLCFCFLIFNWVDLLGFFLPLKYCTIVLWGNIFIWLLVVLINVF